MARISRIELHGVLASHDIREHLITNSHGLANGSPLRRPSSVLPVPLPYSTFEVIVSVARVVTRRMRPLDPLEAITAANLERGMLQRFLSQHYPYWLRRVAPAIILTKGGFK